MKERSRLKLTAMQRQALRMFEGGRLISIHGFRCATTATSLVRRGLIVRDPKGWYSLTASGEGELAMLPKPRS